MREFPMVKPTVAASSATATKRGSVVFLIIGLVLLTGAVSAAKLVRVKKHRSSAPEDPGTEKPASGGKPDAADIERKRLMREMGKKGAQKRWEKKKKIDAPPAPDTPDDNPAISA